MRMLGLSSILTVTLVPSASKSLVECDQRAELHSSDFLPSLIASNIVLYLKNNNI